MSTCPCVRWRTLQLSRDMRENEREGLLPDCRVDVRENESKDDWSWMHLQQLTFWTMVRQSLTMTWKGRLRVTDSRMYAGFRYARLAWSLMHTVRILLLAHGLTVKLSLCQSSHCSPARRIHVAACPCRYSKCNLLLAQARPRMTQHPSSVKTWEVEAKVR